MSDAIELFNSSDFTTISVTTTFANTTSNAAVLAAEQVALLEIEDDGVVLELPVNACAENHNAILELVRDDPSRREDSFNLRVTGRVTSKEKTGDPARVRVKVLLLQYDEKLWRRILDLGEKRQEAVTRFLNSVRG